MTGNNPKKRPKPKDGKLYAGIKPNKSVAYKLLKRAFDVLVSSLGMIVLSPLYLITAAAIKIEDPKGKVFYTAPRGGLHGKPFPCVKFRSMYADADIDKVKLMDRNEMSGPVFKINNDPRITRVGRVIRKTSIDELPQMLNVWLGQMSVVGPRPLPIQEANAVSGAGKARELVKPGLTCIWQVSGRNNVDFDRWMEMDLEYVRKQSLLFDLWILLKTVPVIISTKGAS